MPLFKVQQKDWAGRWYNLYARSGLTHAEAKQAIAEIIKGDETLAPFFRVRRMAQ